jgi:hypothetical protein
MRQFVYLTSANYSGSTLLTFLLNGHPQIATIGELKGASKDPETHMCSCGTAIGRCPFWTRVLEGLHQRGVPFRHENVYSQCGFRIADSSFANRMVRHYYRAAPLELARDVLIALSPACRRAFPRIVKTNEAFVDVVSEVTQARIFLDSSKDPIRLKYLLRVDSLAVKVIHMIRDGRGVMNSAMKRLNCSPEEGVTEWVRREGEIARILRKVPEERRLRLRYEDLCANPVKELERVFRFLGVAPEDANLDFRSVEHHILGNAMRFEKTSEIRQDTKWMRELTPEQIEIFERIGGALNRKYGNDPHVPHTSEDASPVLT